MIFPGALDIASFPETARIINAIRALDTQIAANPGNATLVSQRQAIVDFWKQAFARAIGVITAHEMMHVMMGAPDALVNGHTQLPDFDLLSDASQFNFERITGVLISNAANFPAAGTFTVRSLDALPRPNDANQARLDVLFPVPPASPFS
jgi:hypothetical protein